VSIDKAGIGRAILEYFYDVWRGVESSDRGRISCELAVNALCKRTGADRAAITAKLAEMVENGLVKREASQTALGPYETYTIGARGLQLTENALSLSFDKPANHDYDGQYVAVDPELASALVQLRTLIESDVKLSEALRAAALRDLAIITVRIREVKPDVGVIKAAWAGVKSAATASSQPAVFATCAALLSKELRGRLGNV
jgi:DNA-binding MarR family transcriptional regulator